MSDAGAGAKITPEHFFGSIVPGQFQKNLERLEREREALAKQIGDLRAMRVSLRVVLAGDPPRNFFLNLADGKLSLADAPAEPPLVTIEQSEADWAAAVEREGVGGFDMFSGKAAAPGSMSLTPARAQKLRALKGSLRLVLTDLPGGEADRAWSITTRFGDAPEGPPTTTMTMKYEDSQAMRSGGLNPQQAFMAGKIKIAGDMSFAMQLGMAMMG